MGWFRVVKASLAYGATLLLRKGALAGVLSIWAFSAQAQAVVVAALGDSLTAGYGLPSGDGFVPQMQTWLTEQGLAVDLRNAGVSGDTTRGGLSRMDWTLTDDVQALIVTLGGNDLLRGLPPESSRANLEAILQKAQARDVKVLLVGMQAPGNYGASYKQAFDAMYPDLAQSYGALHFNSFFQGIEGGDLDQARAQYMQGDGIHPSKAGVLKIVEAMGPTVAELVRGVPDP